MIRALVLAVCLIVGAHDATGAEPLPFPAPATLSWQTAQHDASLRIATAAWTAAAGTAQTRIDGLVMQSAYRLDGTTLSSRALMAPLRDHLVAAGFDLVFECETASCGGFDFRYDLSILPEPGMHVDLGDFRYLAGIKRRGSGADEAVVLIVSRSANAGFVQFDRVMANPAANGDASTAPLSAQTTPTAAASVAAPATSADGSPTGTMAARLETGGAFALDDLIFGSGSGTLAEGDYASLAELAAYLSANPDRQIALVGHTDASGGLDANIALSRRRAESVRQVLINAYDVLSSQVLAEGVGFLSPRASNLTDAGRAANRRVEVMLTSTK